MLKYKPIGTLLKLVMSLGSVFAETVPNSDAQVSPLTPARAETTPAANQERMK